MYPHLSVILFSFLLFGNNSPVPQCERVKAQPDAWVAAKVDALVAAAHAAYEDKNDAVVPAYEKVVGGIAGTLSQCGLSKDEGHGQAPLAQH